MEKAKRIEQIRGLAIDAQDAIGMILSACADKGSSDGVLLSWRKFDEAAEMIAEYFGLV